MTLCWLNFFQLDLSKGNKDKQRKKITDIGWKNKERQK